MRAAIFIDAGYLINQLKSENVNVDYARFADYLLAPLRRHISLDLLRCYFYYCPPWMSQNPTEADERRMAAHKKTLDLIEGLDRWAYRAGVLERRFDRNNKEVFEQKRVDVMMSVDLVRHASAGHIQHAVIVAGDSDFIPAIRVAKDSGVTITLWTGTDKSAHRDMVQLADEVHAVSWRNAPIQRSTSSRASQPKTASKVKKSTPTKKTAKTKTTTKSKNVRRTKKK